MKDAKKTLETWKGVATFAVSIGVGSIVMSAVEHVTPVNTKIVNRIFRTAGAAALSGMIADRCVDYTNDKVDELVEQISITSEEKEVVDGEES